MRKGRRGCGAAPTPAHPLGPSPLGGALRGAALGWPTEYLCWPLHTHTGLSRDRRWQRRAARHTSEGRAPEGAGRGRPGRGPPLPLFRRGGGEVAISASFSKRDFMPGGSTDGLTMLTVSQQKERSWSAGRVRIVC